MSSTTHTEELQDPPSALAYLPPEPGDLANFTLVSYLDRSDAQRKLGVCLDGRVNRVRPDLEVSLPPDMVDIAAALVADGPSAFRGWMQHVRDQEDSSVAIGDVRLLPPIARPNKIIGVGLNYVMHASETGEALPEVPSIFAKFSNTVSGPFDTIALPGTDSSVDYEGELGVIVGRECRSVSMEEALQYVAGYCIVDDVTSRRRQLATSQWSLGKSLDGFAPFGPGLVPRYLIEDPQSLRLVTRVNGELRQDATTRDMVFSVSYLLSFLSQGMTLYPGDLIATGTPAGVGMSREPPEYLRDGDVVEVSITGLGKIRNRFKTQLSEAATRPVGR